MNPSKTSNPRCQDKWKNSGALGTIITAVSTEIGGDFYVKTPAALAILLKELRGIGYTIDNLREVGYHKERGVSAETMEKEGWSLWFAHLEDIRRGKCKSCNGLIGAKGIQVHGHRCERCGAVTYYEIIDGSTICFSFITRDGERNSGVADVKLRVKRWDTEQGYLYCYPEVLDGLWSRGKSAKKYLDDHKNKWDEIVEGGQRLIRIKYPEPWDYDVAAINPSEITGHYWNHSIVRVWKGKEYPEYFGDFPLRESMSIYETWHWAPLEPSPTLHKRVLEAVHNTDDKGWHYQDGRPWFSRASFSQMGRFVQHFTTLDARAWKKKSRNFRRDGPGGIDDVAAFCHPRAEVENRPNAGNILVGLSKALSGQKLTDGEVGAMKHTMADRPTRKMFFG